MKNYEEAFKNISEVSENSSYDDKDLIAIDLHTLRELVDKAPYHKELEDKATPKKPIPLPYSDLHKKDTVLSCDSCKKPIINVWIDISYKPYFCHYCGQKLDWSKDE